MTGRDDNEGECSSHGHALLQIDKQRVLLHLQIVFHSLNVRREIAVGSFGFFMFGLQLVQAGCDDLDLIDQGVVDLVRAVLHLGPAAAPLEPGLRHPEREVELGEGSCQPLQARRHVVCLLESEDRKVTGEVEHGEGWRET